MGDTLAEIRKNGLAYLYISPFYLLYGVFGLFPVLFSLYISFTKWDGFDVISRVGFSNYLRLFQDPLFWKSLMNTLIILVGSHVPMLMIALVLAFIINSKAIKGRDFFRTSYFLPSVTSEIAVSLIFLTFYGSQYGFLNWIFKLVGLMPVDWLGGNGFWIKPAIILLIIWRWVGWNMVIYLAGLQGIDQTLYEAAKVDGATTPQIFWKVTLPLLKPIIMFSIILSLIGGLKIFSEPYMLVGNMGGANYQGLTVTMYLYQNAFEYLRFGYASAMAYVLFAITLLLSLLNTRLFREDN